MGEEKSVFMACEDCHMFSNGALECDVDDVLQELEFLKQRLRDWHERPPSVNSLYDQIVKSLVVCAVSQCEMKLAQLKRSQKDHEAPQGPG